MTMDRALQIRLGRVIRGEHDHRLLHPHRKRRLAAAYRISQSTQRWISTCKLTEDGSVWPAMSTRKPKHQIKMGLFLDYRST